MEKGMNGPLEKGQELDTIYGARIIVGDLLGSGGQGFVYRVSYDGVPKALKWYKTKPQLMSETFRENLKKNIAAGSPDSRFLWPQDMTKDFCGSYGYVMDLRPKGFYDLTDFMMMNVHFPSFRQAIDASLNIVTAFRILHNRGLSYQDLNDGNFFIEPGSGRVLVGDNDNVTTNGTSTGILGKARFMAPEIVTREKLPDVHSDRYSMAVILFLILFLSHPLEGSKSITPMMTDEYARHLYGTDARFIMDGGDNPNRPVPDIHDNVLQVWPYMPSFARELFLKAFGQEALKNPNRRPPEIDWLKMLVRLRSSIVPCPCGNEVFTDNGMVWVSCEGCGTRIRVPFSLDLETYDLPAVWGTRLYRCQTGICNEDEALDPVAQIVVYQKETRKMGVRNMSKNNWSALTPSGKSKTVAPKDVIPLRDGIRFKADDIDIHIRENHEQ